MTNIKKWKLLYVIMTSCLVLTLILPNMIAYASAVEEQPVTSKLHVETEVGYNSTYLPGKSVPVKFKLTNGFNRDLKGELVLNIRDSNGASIAHITPLEITKGSTVETVITADGSFSKPGTWIQFYEGGVDRGESIEISGTRYVEGKSISTSHVIGIAASDPDTLNFVAFFNNNGVSTTPLVLGEDFYAGTQHDLAMFSIIALNDVAVSQWSQQKVQAIKDWVARGGTLLVGGGAGYSATAAAFAELLPVEGQATVEWDGANLLMDYTGSQEPLAALQVINGKLVRGQSMLEDQGIPIVASNDYGRGQVIYTAFDLGLKPFANWDGRTAFLENVLSEQLMLQNMSYQPDYWWGLDNSSSQFPRLKSPEVGGLLVIFVIYMLIVAPVMYLVLRRLDRREWSWWLIPSLAVVSTAIIVLIGTKDKSDLYVNGITVAQINNGIVRELNASKVFVPNSKDIRIALPDNAYVRLNSQSYSNNAEVSTSKQQRIYSNGASREAVYTNNKYWTTKSVTTDEEIYNTEQYGELTAVVERQENSNVLNITNNTNRDVEHLSLAVDGMLYYIGALAAGEQTTYTLPASLTVNNATKQPYYYGGNYGSELVNGSGLQWEQLARETSLLDNGALISDSASLIAFSYDDSDRYVVNGKAVKSDEMTLWVVNITEQLMIGLEQQIAVVPMSVKLIDQGSYTMSDQYITLDQSAVLMKYQVPSEQGQQQGSRLGQIMPDVNAQHFAATFSIFNEQLQQWEALPTDKFELAPYLTQFNMLQVKLDSGQNYYEGSVPKLLLDREVQ